MGQQPYKWTLKGQFVVQVEQITNITLRVLYLLQESLSSLLPLPYNEFSDPQLCSGVFQTNEWRLSCVNKEFSVCPSYPPVVIVPKCVDDEALRKVALFRHGGRFPVLSYYHKKNGMVSWA